MDNVRLYNATAGKVITELNTAEHPEEEIEFMEWTLLKLIEKLQEIVDDMPEDLRNVMTVGDFMEAFLNSDEDPETEEEP